MMKIYVSLPSVRTFFVSVNHLFLYANYDQLQTNKSSLAYFMSGQQRRVLNLT